MNPVRIAARSSVGEPSVIVGDDMPFNERTAIVVPAGAANPAGVPKSKFTLSYLHVAASFTLSVSSVVGLARAAGGVGGVYRPSSFTEFTQSGSVSLIWVP